MVSVVPLDCSLKGDCFCHLPLVPGTPSAGLQQLPPGRVSCLCICLSVLHSVHSSQNDLLLNYKLDLFGPRLKACLWWLPILLRMKSEFLTTAHKSLVCADPSPTSLISHTPHSIHVTFSYIGLFLLSLDIPGIFLTEGSCTSSSTF